METRTGLRHDGATRKVRLVIWVTETGDGGYGNGRVFRRNCKHNAAPVDREICRSDETSNPGAQLTERGYRAPCAQSFSGRRSSPTGSRKDTTLPAAIFLWCPTVILAGPIGAAQPRNTTAPTR